MKSRSLGTALAVVLTASAMLAAPASGDDTSDARRVAVCLVPRGEADSEHTIHVSERAADQLVRTTRSYRGPCASYGESASLGGGSLTAYSQAEDGQPTSIGVVFPASTLDGLPHHPPTAGLWCYDKNDDGTVDPMTECAGGYENALHLSANFRESVDSPFNYVLVNWNPHGHVPTDVYDLPHFDIHFYMTPNSERLAIRPGPCPALVNCDDYQLGKILPEPRYIAPDYIDANAIEPAMGNHLVDPTSPEFHGARFAHTFIYGTWNGEITFYEPMVTHELFSELVAGTRDDTCHRVKLPIAWQQPGWYPTEYCLRYRENRDELTASMEGFVYRHAT